MIWTNSLIHAEDCSDIMGGYHIIYCRRKIVHGIVSPKHGHKLNLCGRNSIGRPCVIPSKQMVREIWILTCPDTHQDIFPVVKYWSISISFPLGHARPAFDELVALLIRVSWLMKDITGLTWIRKRRETKKFGNIEFMMIVEFVYISYSFVSNVLYTRWTAPGGKDEEIWRRLNSHQLCCNRL